MCCKNEHSPLYLIITYFLVKNVAETVFISLSENHFSGCPNLWTWSVAVVISGWFFITVLVCFAVFSSHIPTTNRRRQDQRCLTCLKYASKFFIAVLNVPMGVRGVILALTLLKDECRTQWQESNPELLWGTSAFTAIFAGQLFYVSYVWITQCIIDGGDQPQQSHQPQQSRQSQPSNQRSLPSSRVEIDVPDQVEVELTLQRPPQRSPPV